MTFSVQPLKTQRSKVAGDSGCSAALRYNPKPLIDNLPTKRLRLPRLPFNWSSERFSSVRPVNEEADSLRLTFTH